MKVLPTGLPGCVVIEPDVFADDRGFFLETFQVERYQREAGIDLPFVQDNHSRSAKGVLRGLHFQLERPQGKLVRVVNGEVFDVAVDLRRDSPAFGRWEGVVLSGQNRRQLWMPPGFAHGFLVLSEVADFEYKCTDYYSPEDEKVIRWNDPDVAVKWPGEMQYILSKKDSTAPGFAELFSQ